MGELDRGEQTPIRRCPRLRRSSLEKSIDQGGPNVKSHRKAERQVLRTFYRKHTKSGVSVPLQTDGDLAANRKDRT